MFKVILLICCLNFAFYLKSQDTICKVQFLGINTCHTIQNDSLLISDCRPYIDLEKDSCFVNFQLDCEYSCFDFKIYSRTGEIIFDSKNSQAYWDAKSRAPGLYIYTLEFTTLSGEEKNYRGHFYTI